MNINILTITPIILAEQEYLPDAIIETKFYDPGNNSREMELENF